MSDHPVSVVVDCSKAGPPDPELAAHFDSAALELLRNGDFEKAGRLMEEAKEILAASTIATETVVELTEDEIAQNDIDKAAEAERATADQDAASERQALAAKLAAGKATSDEIQRALALLLG